MSKFESFPRPTRTYHAHTYDRISKHHGFHGAGKTILVAGGSSGVGYSICQAFAEADVARIAIISRSPGPQATARAALEAAHPTVQIVTYAASITDHARMAAILDELGPVDVLVLSAAVVHRLGPATAVTAAEMQAAFDVNVLAPFHLVQAYLSTALPAAGTKTIIHVSSAAAQTRSPGRVGYGPSKAAATQVMQHVAAERANPALRVFSFHPGAFYTPSVAVHYAEDATPWEDINLPAHFARWLAGPESAFLNGRYLWAHWDVDELMALRDRVERDSSFLTIGLVV
ncbi:putative NADP(+)-dependent dehydrogenase [Aspergillus uvarum CBS 121591]|uniref:Putative NADP(+)-dependent dehydrogenase n=1 Tax=Aspergillus uvarum CBS 121591 TaxID=1448315 RepID=A0A319CLE0_9EURO|nr:putative NADP(+)-dependent dehydrogenase [Aspergillus uvarum CBS 121591]PYH86355.1 putative NADP(+)-dependent dehydrogenase [Aspergillus uvarum CBS 121591]